MKKEIINKQIKNRCTDPVWCYILAAAGIVGLNIAFRGYMQGIYQYFLVIPCLLFLGTMLERGVSLRGKTRFLIPGAMLLWFVMVCIRRGVVQSEQPGNGMFVVSCLFAFPLATILWEEKREKAMRLFAAAYLVGAAGLTASGLLLVLDCLPGLLGDYVRWSGARLVVFWHPNVLACFLMIGVVFCTVFLSQGKDWRKKAGLAILLVLMMVIQALTGCRTAILLTGLYLGAVVFFWLVRRSRMWFVPGLLVVMVIVAAVYAGARQMFQINETILLERYTSQSAAQTALELPEELMGTEPVDTAVPAETPAPTETQPAPITVDPNTGEMHLVTDSVQGTIGNDIGTLNSRTEIWKAAYAALRNSREILLWGIATPGEYVSYYFYVPIPHTHNAWVECFVSMGFGGFALAVLFTMVTAWNCLMILLKQHQDLWKRNVALLMLCLLVAAMMEPYLFYTHVDYHLVEFLFFLCAGYLAQWQEDDNARILAVIRSRIPFLKK